MIESTLEPPSGPALNAHRTGVDSRQRIGQPAGVSEMPDRPAKHAMTAILAGGDLEPADQPPANAATLDMAHGPDVRCFCPVVVSRYRRPRSHEHSGRQAKVAASSLHTFTPGGSPVFRLRASGTTRGITPPGPDDGVTIFGNARITPHPAGALTAAAPAPHQGRCARRVQDRPPPSGTPGAWTPAPPGARPRGTGLG